MSGYRGVPILLPTGHDGGGGTENRGGGNTAKTAYPKECEKKGVYSKRPRPRMEEDEKFLWGDGFSIPLGPIMFLSMATYDSGRRGVESMEGDY